MEHVHIYKYLTSFLNGDELAAEYLLYNLISKIESRKDGLLEPLQIGRFSLNLKTNSKLDLKQICLVSCLIKLDLISLNKSPLYPKYDADNEKLEMSPMQLINGTNLLIDETCLSNGKLEAQGVLNISALNDLTTKQVILFDYGHHKLEIKCDIPVLITSEGKSLISVNFHLISSVTVC